MVRNITLKDGFEFDFATMLGAGRIQNSDVEAITEKIQQPLRETRLSFQESTRKRLVNTPLKSEERELPNLIRARESNMRQRQLDVKPARLVNNS